MADHIWTILCERHLVDPQSGIVSLMDIGESLRVENLNEQIESAAQQGKKGTFVKATAELVTWWHRSDPSEETLNARIVLQDPIGRAVSIQAVTAQWGEKAFTRVFLAMSSLPVTMPGIYWFIVEQQKIGKTGKKRWVGMTKIPLHVDSA